MGPSSEEQGMGQGSAAALNAHGSTDTTTTVITYTLLQSHVGQRGLGAKSPKQILHEGAIAKFPSARTLQVLFGQLNHSENFKYI